MMDKDREEFWRMFHQELGKAKVFVRVKSDLSIGFYSYDKEAWNCMREYVEKLEKRLLQLDSVEQARRDLFIGPV
jgi:hypothetical protein